MEYNLYPGDFKLILVIRRGGGQEEKGGTEDEVVGWHHQLRGHEFQETLGDSEGLGSLACCRAWGRKKLDMT